jgi:uncharacterized protein (TIGR02687 family)
MNLQQIKTSLQQRFADNHRLVFWHDYNAEFSELLSELALENVTLINVNNTPALALKVLIELQQPTHSFLLYQTGQTPDPEDDWLLDIRLYAAPFAADKTSMLMQELGLLQPSVREHLLARAKYFNSKDRVNRLQKLLEPQDDSLAIDRKIMTVLTKVELSDFYHLLIGLFDQIPDADLAQLPPVWQDFENYGVLATFWHYVEHYFGYLESQPSLKNLLTRLLVTEFVASLQADCPTAYKHLLLPNTKAGNVGLLLGQWRDSSIRHASYDALSTQVALAIKITETLASLSIEQLSTVKTFLAVEKDIASQLRNRVLDTQQTIDAAEVRAIAQARKDGYWTKATLSKEGETVPRYLLSRVYDALIAAAELFARHHQQAGLFSFSSPKAGVDAYTQRLYGFDQLYRLFCEAADTVDAGSLDILKSLRPQVEATYSQGFLKPLALAWTKYVEAGLLTSWQIEGVINQQHFFKHCVQPIIGKDEERRVFVIISDALRYEAGQELSEQINSRYRLTSELQPMLGVLPSYTALGMAALLPHQSLDYDAAGSVTVDGQATNSFETRQKIIAKAGGVAVKFDDFMAWKKDEGREKIKGQQIVYIYHDQIDATGDTARTEGEAFAAVRRTIKELDDGISRIINHLNGNTIFVTADHGFLFREGSPSALDKNAIDNKPQGTVKAKKRYLIGRELGANDTAHVGRMAKTAGVIGNMEFWVPKGLALFHFVGGARFVHGGATLQEVLVPLLKIQHKKGKGAEKTRVSTVSVSVLGNHFKITTSRYRFRMLQTEAVSERIVAATLKIGLYEHDEPISNIETITFDSASGNMEERIKDIWLTLAHKTFNKANRYYLVLRHADTGLEEQRLDVTIDLAFSNDF